MDILSIAQQWAREEIFSSKFFVVVRVVFIAIAVGFWQVGKSELARAYIVPMAVCGGLLLIIGGGLIYSNYTRLNSFAGAYNMSKTEFVKAEMERTQSTIRQTNSTIYLWIPALIVLAALLIIFIDKSVWRASCITSIAFLIVLMIVYSNSYSRIVECDKALKNSKMVSE